MSMINWIRKPKGHHPETANLLLVQISDLESESTKVDSISESICCSEFIINGGVCSQNHKVDPVEGR